MRKNALLSFVALILISSVSFNASATIHCESVGSSVICDENNALIDLGVAFPLGAAFWSYSIQPVFGYINSAYIQTFPNNQLTSVAHCVQNTYSFPIRLTIAYIIILTDKRIFPTFGLGSARCLGNGGGGANANSILVKAS